MARAGRPDEAEIVVRRDGRVLFRPFTDAMLEVAAELAPDEPDIQSRLRRRRGARKRGEHETAADR